MATVRLPSPMRAAAGGIEQVTAGGTTVRRALEEVCQLHPSLKERLFREPGTLQPHLAVMVDGAMLEDLDAPVDRDSEIVIIPAIGGGSPPRGGPA